MKILNLNEGSFPIKLSFELENHNVPNIGKLTNNLSVEAQILKISKNLYKCDGSIDILLIIIYEKSSNKITCFPPKQFYNFSKNYSPIKYI